MDRLPRTAARRGSVGLSTLRRPRRRMDQGRPPPLERCATGSAATGNDHDHRSTMTVHDGNAAGGSAGREPPTDESRKSQETDGRSVGNLELFFALTFVY